MTSIHDETRDKIKKWILESKKFTLEDKGADKLNAFTLLVNTKDSKRIMINIIGSKTNNKKILICWGWQMTKGTMNTIKKAIPIAVKRRCEVELKVEIGVRNLSIEFHPSMIDLEVIWVEKYLSLDRLTKARFFELINLLLSAYIFTARTLVKHFKIPRPSNFSKLR